MPMTKDTPLISIKMKAPFQHITQILSLPLEQLLHRAVAIMIYALPLLTTIVALSIIYFHMYPTSKEHS